VCECRGGSHREKSSLIRFPVQELGKLLAQCRLRAVKNWCCAPSPSAVVGVRNTSSLALAKRRPIHPENRVFHPPKQQKEYMHLMSSDAKLVQRLLYGDRRQYHDTPCDRPVPRKS
jgi:hypothetical protein